VDERYGLRITEVLDGGREHPLAAAAATDAAAGASSSKVEPQPGGAPGAEV
jgi:hypothetical protein